MSLHGKKVRLTALDRSHKPVTVYLSNESHSVLHITVAGASAADQRDYYLSFNDIVKALCEFRHHGAPARHAKKDDQNGKA